MHPTDKEIYQEEDFYGMRLDHQEYFEPFRDVVRKNFTINEEITLYRTCQSLPCNEDDNLARIFRKNNGQEPKYRVYSEDELTEVDEKTKYERVTKGALSFNDFPEAAIKSAKDHDANLRKERGGRRKSKTYRKSRGDKVGKFVFPAGTVLISEMKYHHCNILRPDDVNIEEYRDTSFEKTVDYEEYEAD